MARKKKKPARSLLPYKLERDATEYLSHTLLKVNDYRTYQFDPNNKIRTRLFYFSDDLPETVWALPIPQDWEDLYSYNSQLISMSHNGRVGIAEVSVIESVASNDDDDDFDDVYACIFEDYNDLLIFKLALV